MLTKEGSKALYVTLEKTMVNLQNATKGRTYEPDEKELKMDEKVEELLNILRN